MGEIDMHESEQYKDIQPFIESAAMSTHSALQQIDLLRNKMVDQAAHGLLLYADAVKISQAIRAADKAAVQADIAVADLLAVLKAEVA